jgi:hypothetical protein
MKTLSVYDPALCCSSGVCGTEVDQALVSFSADVTWLKQQGVSVERLTCRSNRWRLLRTVS